MSLELDEEDTLSRSYIACDDMDFGWSHSEVASFRHMWIEGLSVDDIARAFDRPVDEIAILVIDQARQSKIKHRTGGIYGNRRPTS